MLFLVDDTHDGAGARKTDGATRLREDKSVMIMRAKTMHNAIQKQEGEEL